MAERPMADAGLIPAHIISQTQPNPCPEWTTVPAVEIALHGPHPPTRPEWTTIPAVVTIW